MKKVILLMVGMMMACVSYGYTVEVSNKTDSEQDVALWYRGRGVCQHDKWLNIPPGESRKENAGICCLNKLARIEKKHGDYYKAKQVKDFGFGCTSHVIEIQKKNGEIELVRK